VPFGDPLTLFSLVVGLAGAALFLRMVGKEKDRRDRHIFMRFYELEQEASKEGDKKAEAGENEAQATAQEGKPRRTIPELNPSQNS